MKVLLLGSPGSPLVERIAATGDSVEVTRDPLSPERAGAYDLLVSHGYRHILRPPVLDRLPDRVVNLHISLLPWNRGAHPNVWSALDRTPSGVTVHHIDEGVDTGDLIAQREIEIGDEETLASSYERLQTEIVDLFTEHWQEIREGTAARSPQSGEGSLHRVHDLESVRHLLIDGWNTTVGALRAAGRGLGDAP